MKTNITSLGFGQVLEVELKEGESIFSEPGAFLAAQGEISIESKIHGGLISGALRAIGGGESLFINEIKAVTDSTVVLGMGFPGEIVELKLDGGAFLLGDGVYIAHHGDLDVNAEFGGLSSFLAGSGFFFLNVKGKGSVFIGGESGVQRVELSEGETMYLDNLSFVAANADAKIERAYMGKGLKSKVFSGEGVVFKVSGPAEVYYKAVNPKSFLALLKRYLPKM